MPVTIYEVAAHIEEDDVDGRTTAGLWGHEQQYHATRESAEAASARLQKRADQNDELVRYDVHELTRDRFPNDAIGDQEWRRACKQAGVDPVTGKPRGSS